MIEVGGPSSLWAVSLLGREVDLGYMRKQSEQDRETVTSASAPAPGLLR